MDTPAPTISEDLAPPRRRRSGIGRWPFGMLAVAVLRLIDAAALIAVGLAIRGIPLGDLPIIASNPELTRALGLIFGGLAVAGVVGLLLFQRWGWVLTMVLVGLSLSADLIRVALGQPPYLALLLHVVTAFYLNGRAVRALAHATPAEEEAREEAAAAARGERTAP